MALFHVKGAVLEQKAGSINISSWYESATDEELVVAALVADFAAFETLIARYRSAVTKVALSIVGVRAIAEDVAQDTFVAAFQSLPSLIDPARFGPWVCRIARFRALRVSNRERKIQSVGAEPLEAMINERYEPVGHADRSGDPAIATLRQAEQIAIMDALGSLSTEHREALYLHYCEEWPIERIAEYLSVPATTIKGRLFLGREALRKRLFEDATFYDRRKGPERNERRRKE